MVAGKQAASVVVIHVQRIAFSFANHSLSFFENLNQIKQNVTHLLGEKRKKIQANLKTNETHYGDKENRKKLSKISNNNKNEMLKAQHTIQQNHISTDTAAYIRMGDVARAKPSAG